MTARPDNLTNELPSWTYAKWADNKLLNADAAPLWSGSGAPPKIGDVIHTSGERRAVTVIGYYVLEDWLMLWGRRHDDNAEGNLAGCEIAYPSKAIH